MLKWIQNTRFWNYCFYSGICLHILKRQTTFLYGPFQFQKKILLVWNIFSLFQDKPLFLQYLLIGPPDAYWDYKRKETVKDGL